MMWNNVCIYILVLVSIYGMGHKTRHKYSVGIFGCTISKNKKRFYKTDFNSTNFFNYIKHKILPIFTFGFYLLLFNFD